MDEDFGFDSGFDDVGSADLDIDSGFDDTSLDTDLSLDDIGSDDILGDDLGSSDLSLDTMDDFDSFEDIETSELDTTLAEEDFLTETDDGLDLTDFAVSANDITDLSVENDSLELDDFSDDVDTLESDDISSLTELDEGDTVESVSEDEMTVDDTADEDIITDTEDDGYYENIPNEMEPFVMEEAQTETASETEDLVPEFDEEFPETPENSLETDISEVSELPDETVPDEEVTVEGSDTPEEEKTPYEAMRDYMYEHNYGQMDYSEYSQDPEWQALNEQYTASLEETPVTEDATEDSGYIPDTDELQELQDGDTVDIQSENDIVDSDISEAFEESIDIVPEVTGEMEEVAEEEALEAAGVDVPEGDKTPYEAMRDYMYEHNYGQMDYPEYSQDPEWQAINEQYTASLDNTPATDDTPSDSNDQIWDTADTEEPQELNDGDYIDVHNDASDSIEESFVADEFDGGSDTDSIADISDNLSDISDDSAADTVDISATDSFDTAESPEINDENTDYSDDVETDTFDDSFVTEDTSYESFDVPETDIVSEISDESDDIFDFEDSQIDFDQDPEIQLQDDSETEYLNTPEEGIELSGETSEEDEIEESPSSDINKPYDNTEESSADAQSGDIVSETEDYDINDVSSEAEEFGAYEIPGSLADSEMADTTEIPDDVSDSPPYVREYDDFETLQLIENPEFYDTGQFYEQGINEYGFEGTCGPTSQANAINTLLGNNELTENKVLEIAVDNNLCDITDDVVNSGGTTTENFMDLYDKVNESIGDKINAEVFDYDSALSVSEMADRLDEGSVLNVAVDSATLWGENDHIPGMLAENEYTDHWITVTGVDRTETGNIAGFDIIDSGGGVSYVDADTYERMCFGEDGREMLDPTCIVVSKKQEI